MSIVELRGRLICAHGQDAMIVRRHLPQHIELTRAEPGCLRFDVQQSDDPLAWTVSEEFVSQAALDMHQARVRAGDWGRATVGIKRDYAISYAGT
ncbi:MAG TPA: antibiotic biosynthesis monooxygenase [Ruania sp.]|nr:antibiotic biosynthesis monooxygenase [Ruania sp.]